MITLTCKCGNLLQIAAAGKEVICTACGASALAPLTAPSAIEPRAVHTISSPEARSRPSSADETLGERPNASAELTNFLAPPEQADELGRLGVFRVLKILGHGGMGAVFLAEDPKLRRKVALKVMLPEMASSETSRQRFLREAQAAASLEHDNIVPILHVGEDGGVPYIVMPFLKGQPLSERLPLDAPLPTPEILKIASEMAEALAAAHARGLIHRDIKPANIWLETRGQGSESGSRILDGARAHDFRVKLLDFGLAHLTVVDAKDHLTRTGAILGTPGYMSPEQVDGKPLDGRSDLFSLGCVLYRLATGRPAFPGTTLTEKIVAVATHVPLPARQLNNQIPVDLSRLIEQMLAKTPDHRPASASEVADRLAVMARDLPTIKPAEPTIDLPTPIPAKPRRRPWKLLAFLAAVLLIGSAALLIVQQQLSADTPKGTLRINADDPNVEVVIKKDGAIVRDSTSERKIELDVGDYEIELSRPTRGLKLSPDRFSIKRDATETVKIWFEKADPSEDIPEPIPADLHRRVAEWVLEQPRGNVVLDPQGHFTKVSGLPKTDFKCSLVHFGLPSPDALPQRQAAWLRALPAEARVIIHLESPQWTDENIRRFVPHLREFPNPGVAIHFPSAVTDEGLSHLRKVDGLTGLSLADLKVSDEGVRQLQVLTKVHSLDFYRVPVTDKTVELLVSNGKCRRLVLINTAATGACVPELAKNPDLEYLDWRGARLTDHDLQRLATCKKLQQVYITAINATNEGIRHLQKLPILFALGLTECGGLDDSTFDYLEKCKNLQRLFFIENAKVTDAGLEKVKNFPRLEDLYLSRTNVTAEGVKKLRADLPKLRVNWDGDPKENSK